MLVLSRRPGEEIILPELNIKISIMDIRNGKVRVGIDAPKEIKIYRSEVLERINQKDDKSI